VKRVVKKTGFVRKNDIYTSEAYFGRIGVRAVLDGFAYGIMRLHSSAAEGVVMVQP